MESMCKNLYRWASSMVGSIKKFITFAKEKNPNIFFKSLEFIHIKFK